MGKRGMKKLLILGTASTLFACSFAPGPGKGTNDNLTSQNLDPFQSRFVYNNAAESDKAKGNSGGAPDLSASEKPNPPLDKAPDLNELCGEAKPYGTILDGSVTYTPNAAMWENPDVLNFMAKYADRVEELHKMNLNFGFHYPAILCLGKSENLSGIIYDSGNWYRIGSDSQASNCSEDYCPVRVAHRRMMNDDELRGRFKNAAPIRDSIEKGEYKIEALYVGKAPKQTAVETGTASFLVSGPTPLLAAIIPNREAVAGTIEARSAPIESLIHSPDSVPQVAAAPVTVETKKEAPPQTSAPTSPVSATVPIPATQPKPVSDTKGPKIEPAIQTAPPPAVLPALYATGYRAEKLGIQGVLNICKNYNVAVVGSFLSRAWPDGSGGLYNLFMDLIKNIEFKDRFAVAICYNRNDPANVFTAICGWNTLQDGDAKNWNHCANPQSADPSVWNRIENNYKVAFDKGLPIAILATARRTLTDAELDQGVFKYKATPADNVHPNDLTLNLKVNFAGPYEENSDPAIAPCPLEGKNLKNAVLSGSILSGFSNDEGLISKFPFVGILPRVNQSEAYEVAPQYVDGNSCARVRGNGINPSLMAKR